MNLTSLIGRSALPDTGTRLPWDDPGFSERMLREHLDDSHDLASRRSATIDEHTAWLDRRIGDSIQVLDLGCGPGLYTAGLAALGHVCVGIDISPASIRHARMVADRDSLPCTYQLADLREAETGDANDLVLFLFGELSAFPRDDVVRIFEAIARSMASAGQAVVELSTEAHVRRKGAEGTSWYTAPGGLFSEQPHLVLHETVESERGRRVTEHWYVQVADEPGWEAYTADLWSWPDNDLNEILGNAGLSVAERFGDLAGRPHDPTADFQVLIIEHSDRGPGRVPRPTSTTCRFGRPGGALPAGSG